MQTFMFKKFCKRKPKTLLDLYADVMKKHPSYVKTPMSLIMLSTLKLWGWVKLQDCRNCHSLFVNGNICLLTMVTYPSRRQTPWCLQETLSPQEKRRKKNDSLYNLNSSKTGGQNPQGSVPWEEILVLNVASNLRGQEQGFQHQTFHPLFYNLATKIQNHDGTIVYILGLLRN